MFGRGGELTTTAALRIAKEPDFEVALARRFIVPISICYSLKYNQCILYL